MSWLRKAIEDIEIGEVLVADGFDDAAIGIAERCGQPPIVIYDYEACARELVRRDGMSEEEAREFLDFNCVGAWVGEGTPGWLVVKFRMGEVDRG
jgi:hypothetical protein